MSLFKIIETIEQAQCLCSYDRDQIKSAIKFDGRELISIRVKETISGTTLHSVNFMTQKEYMSYLNRSSYPSKFVPCANFE
jgi:hypothetical protein